MREPENSVRIWMGHLKITNIPGNVWEAHPIPFLFVGNIMGNPSSTLSHTLPINALVGPTWGQILMLAGWSKQKWMDGSWLDSWMNRRIEQISIYQRFLCPLRILLIYLRRPPLSTPFFILPFPMPFISFLPFSLLIILFPLTFHSLLSIPPHFSLPIFIHARFSGEHHKLLIGACNIVPVIETVLNMINMYRRKTSKLQSPPDKKSLESALILHEVPGMFGECVQGMTIKLQPWLSFWACGWGSLSGGQGVEIVH